MSQIFLAYHISLSNTMVLSTSILLQVHKYFFFAFIQIMALLPKLPHQPQLLQTGKVCTALYLFLFLMNFLVPSPCNFLFHYVT